MNDQKKKTKNRSFAFILTFLIPGFIGFFGAHYSLKYMPDFNFMNLLFSLGLFLLSFPIHIFLHELGHLIGGYLSGYQFIMFRLFKYVWIQTDEGISRREQVLPSIAGQALMVPPKNEKNPPFLLYHSGGLIMNLITVILLVSIGGVIQNQSVQYNLYFISLAAILLMVTNLIPFKGTDGYNILQSLKQKEKQDEMTNILYMYQDMVHGKSFEDLQKYIDLDKLQDYKNPNTISLLSIHAAYYLEKQDFEQACTIYQTLYAHEADLFPAHKPDILLNYYFLLMLTDPAHKDAQAIANDKIYKQYKKIKQADYMRVYAAEALFLNHDLHLARNLISEGKKYIHLTPTVTEEHLETDLYRYLYDQLNSIQYGTPSTQGTNEQR